IPATSTLIEMEDNSKSDITIQITGSQWKWHYQYFEDDFGFYSLLTTPNDQIKNIAPKGENYLLEVDNPLVIPVNKKIRFLITADDVIHSWWVPAFAVKQDANPGFINEAWTIVNEPGIYRGQCAELCGKDHGFMPIVVKVLSESDYQQWLDKQLVAVKAQQLAEQQSLNATVSIEQSMILGKNIYDSRCAACHQTNGEGIAGAFPALKGSPIALGEVSKHIEIVRDGQAMTAMQAFSGQLSLKELAAVITYERNAWGNDTGDVIQASDIAAQPTIKEKALIPEVINTEVATAIESANPDLGKSVYLARCAACHQVSGAGIPGAFPALKGSPIALGDITKHIDIVVNGKPGTAMTAFAGQLTAQELAAVITYERNAWGNNTGDVVTTSDVEGAK
ncbi:MAG: c-type cytochrome, partial [Gammaproteobacteria bacterium]|nr:c-type cytochrome [Gammaproteobacteria bacterium]